MPRVTNVLVIDDEPRIASFVSRALSAEGFRVDSAPDGVHGLDLARSGRYELVVLDLLLPGMDGVTMLERLMDERPQQRVLVLSALSDVEEKVRCLELGASDYLSKPFALKELVARVRARLRQPGSGPEERYVRIGDVTLDRVRRVADRGSGPVALTAREFALLSYLMERRGEASSRMQLLEDVWGFRFDPGSNIVDACVRRLRAKLGQDVIETVRNVGYRFNAP
jgi:DNA-binding response OmpR family regulator